MTSTDFNSSDRQRDASTHSIMDMGAFIKKGFHCFIASVLMTFGGVAHAGLGGLIEKITGTQTPATLHVHLVDDSKSISEPDRAIYRQAALAEMDSVHPGDRVIVARISQAGLGQFAITDDVSISKSGKHFEDIGNVKKVKARVIAAIDEILNAKAASNATYIMDVFSALTPAINEARSKRQAIRILALTDAIEESSAANFMKEPITDAAVKRIIERRKKDRLLPDLSTASVYFVGGAGPNAKTAKAIEGFWRSYVEASQGTVAYYGRTVPAFNQDYR